MIPLTLVCSAATAATAAALSWHLAPLIGRAYAGYVTALRRAAGDAGLSTSPQRILTLQFLALGICVAAAVYAHPGHAVLLAMVVLALPWLSFQQARRRKRRLLEDSQDALIVSWADALTTVPNLQEAIASSSAFLSGPVRSEVDRLLAQLRLGVDLETALQRFSESLRLPGVEAAVCAAILGRKTGGDLPSMLRRIAASTHEMARLEGVVRTKTSEGRYQAWVMGGIPVGLLLLLDKLNPEWTAPLWNDPIGWVLLGAASILEIVAVALIRKITSVDI